MLVTVSEEWHEIAALHPLCPKVSAGAQVAGLQQQFLQTGVPVKHAH